MKRHFRFISLILALIISFSMLPGCNSTKKDLQAERNEISSAAKRELITLEIWVLLNVNTAKSYTSLDDHKIVKEIESKYNINLKFNHPSGGYIKDQLSLMVSSSNLPDLIKYPFDFYKGGAEAAIKDGVLVNVNDYLEKYAPNFIKIIKANPDINKEVRSDSGIITKFGAILRDEEIKDLPYYGPVIRKDLLDKLNLNIPETIDEWYTVLRSFKDKLKLDIPFAFAGLGYLNGAFTGAYGVPHNGAFYRENGKVLYGSMQPGYKEFLTTFNKWHKEGLIAMNLNTTDNVNKTVAAGKSGAFSTHKQQIEPVYSAAGGKKEDFVLVPAPIPALKKGEKTRFRYANEVVGADAIYITKACKYPIEAVQFIDYLYSDEGRFLETWGIDGEASKIIDGKRKYTELITNNPDGLNFLDAKNKYTLAELSTFIGKEELMGIFPLPEQQEAWKVWGNSAAYDGYLPKNLTLTEEESERFTAIMAEITPYEKNMSTRFVKGEAPLAEFDLFVQRLKSMGIDEAVKIQQAALDRYNKR